MTFFKEKVASRKALIVTLDNVLYPEKDYLLQVYYLFSEFMAYSEQFDANAIVKYMSDFYTENGTDAIFDNTAKQFGIPERYAQNFTLLHETARLPLKLLLFNNVLQLLQEVILNKMQLFILTEGNPAVAINKIKQVEWNNLQEHLKVYFSVEFAGDCVATLNNILHTHQLETSDVVLIVSNAEEKAKLQESKIDSFVISDIL